MRINRLLLAGLLGTALLASGCNYIEGLAYLFGPPREQKAELKLPPGRLAVLVETVQPEEYNPVFVTALYDKLVAIFREEKLKPTFVPLDDVLELRRKNPDFPKWSLQKVGRELEADFVLAISIDRLQVREKPDMPVLDPAVRLHMKLISPDRPAAEARLWPSPTQDREGREVVVRRPTKDASHPGEVDAEMAKLARDLAFQVAAPFYDVDLETLQLREP
jgi:hypothetical protein